MLYVILILLADVLMILGNLLFAAEGGFGDWLSVSGAALLGTAAVIAVDGATAFLIRRLPERLFLPRAPFFHVSSGERRLYRRLGIKKWKGSVPELGMFTGFRKDHLADSRDSAYLGRFLLESNYGVVIHLVNALCGPLILLLPFCRMPGIGIPIIAVNFILSLMPAAILRYNTPGLLRLYRRATEQ